MADHRWLQKHVSLSRHHHLNNEQCSRVLKTLTSIVNKDVRGQLVSTVDYSMTLHYPHTQSRRCGSPPRATQYGNPSPTLRWTSATPSSLFDAPVTRPALPPWPTPHLQARLYQENTTSQSMVQSSLSPGTKQGTSPSHSWPARTPTRSASPSGSWETRPRTPFLPLRRQWYWSKTRQMLSSSTPQWLGFCSLTGLWCSLCCPMAALPLDPLSTTTLLSSVLM